MNTRGKSMRAFTLVEVALALGLFALAIVSILGLLGPAVGRIEDIRLMQAANDIVSQLSADLQHFDGDGRVDTRAFEEIFNLVARAPGVLYVYRGRGGGLRVTPAPAEVSEVEGRVFAARLTVSGVNPPAYLQATGDHFVLSGFTPATYPEAWLGLRVDLHIMPTPAPDTAFEPAEPSESNFLFRYHTAVNR